jgi:hypothetical protein
MSASRLNPFRLLNSVPFGILLMVLIALYMAAGSGRQWLRSTGVDEWPVVRDWFDKTDLEFFNSWPLKTLMALLVVNLTVVTWRKIPLTPPRYGVWCVHAGIITLVLGTAAHYANKLEGRARLYADPVAGPSEIDHYYDKDERSLYVRTGRDTPAAFPLPTLPRFQQYDATTGNEGGLRRRGLWDLQPTLTAADREGRPVKESLTELVGATGDLRVDVIGYYPYADVQTNFDASDPASNTTGVELSMSDPMDPQAARDWYVVASDPRFKTHIDDFSEAQHLDGDADVATKVADAAGQIFRLDATVDGRPGGDKPAVLYVHAGETYPIGTTGYTVKVESFDPAWPMASTGEQVPALTLLVTTPAKQFRRMVLNGHPEATSDFRLGGPSDPPVKMRSPKPLDSAIHIQFAFQDPYHLMPQTRAVRHTLLTPTGSKELVDVEVAATAVATVHHFPTGSGDIALAATVSDDEPAEAAAAHPSIKVHVERREHLDPTDTATPVPPRQRESQADEDGLFQAVKLRLRLGSWARDIVVPYQPYAYDRVQPDPWRGGMVTLPGAVAPLQFQLGNTRRPLPTRLTLVPFVDPKITDPRKRHIDALEVVPFPGGTDAPDAFIQDFRSTITMSGSDDSDTLTEVASLNHPVYFDGGRWLFFQAAYDPEVPHAWTQLGIGNRPAVRVMVTGCGMIFLGLLYAFYAKPVIVRRMKQRALAAAAERAAVRGFPVPAKQPADAAELVES